LRLPDRIKNYAITKKPSERVTFASRNSVNASILSIGGKSKLSNSLIEKGYQNMMKNSSVHVANDQKQAFNLSEIAKEEAK